jgi:hypothetical protein
MLIAIALVPCTIRLVYFNVDIATYWHFAEHPARNVFVDSLKFHLGVLSAWLV